MILIFGDISLVEFILKYFGTMVLFACQCLEPCSRFEIKGWVRIEVALALKSFATSLFKDQDEIRKETPLALRVLKVDSQINNYNMPLQLKLTSSVTKSGASNHALHLRKLMLKRITSFREQSLLALSRSLVVLSYFSSKWGFTHSQGVPLEHLDEDTIRDEIKGEQIVISFQLPSRFNF